MANVLIFPDKENLVLTKEYLALATTKSLT